MRSSFLLVIALLLAATIGLLWADPFKREGTKTFLTSSRLVLIGFWILFFAAFIYFMCSFSLVGSFEDHVQSEQISPDGKYIATLFERDTGATDGNILMISMREGKRKSHTEHDPMVFRQGIVAGLPNKLSIVWQDDHHVIVHYTNPEPGAFQIITNWNDLTISRVQDHF